MNLITGWDLLEQSRVQPGQWLLVTAGNSAVATVVSQFAKGRDIKVVSVVRSIREGLDLCAFGATEVINLSQTDQNLSGLIADLPTDPGSTQLSIAWAGLCSAICFDASPWTGAQLSTGATAQRGLRSTTSTF